MRVVHIITRLILGGAQENTLWNCIDLQELHGDDVTLITGPAEGPEGDLFTQAAERNLPVRVLPELRRSIQPAADWSAYRRIGQILDELRPEVVHTHSSKAGIIGRLVAHRRRVPAIIHTIHGLPFHPYEKWWKNRLYIHAERLAARRCQRIISVANAMTEQALAAGVGRPEQYITIHSGMEVEPFLQPPVPRSAIRQELNLPEAAIVVGKIARLFELKGHDDVIEAARTLAPKHPELHFVFVGGGVWSDRLRQRVRDLGLESRFRFTGLVPARRIPELIGSFDLVVHASLREGLARVLPQSLIAGVPVVSYDVDGAREVVINEQTGVLVPPQDIRALTAGIASLVVDPDRRRRYGAEGRRRFADLFRHQTMTQKIRQVYADVLSDRRR